MFPSRCISIPNTRHRTFATWGPWPTKPANTVSSSWGSRRWGRSWSADFDAGRYLAHAGRIIQENGADIVKTYFVDGFEQIREGIQTPIVIAGGKKIPEAEALEFTANAIAAGADGVDMGRNIFQSEDPVAMIQAVRAVVHEGLEPARAYELFGELRAKLA